MADNAASPRRDSHYNQQRSSLRSDRSPSRSQSRPTSRRMTPHFALDLDSDHDSPSPAPNVPRIPQGAPVQSSHQASTYEHFSKGRHSSQSSREQRLRSFSLPLGPPPPANASRTALSHAGPYAREPPQQLSSSATKLYTVSYLALFAILGTLARLGVQWLTFYPGAPSTFPVLWANFGGTLFMGFLSQDRRLFREKWGNSVTASSQTPLPDEEDALEQRSNAASHAKVKKTIPLYVGLATGFCGSFTSFSSFMRDVFLAFLNRLTTPDTLGPTSREDNYSFMAGLAVIVITIAVCYSAFKVGAHIALLLDRFTPTLPFRLVRNFVDPLVVFLAWGAWLGAIFMAIWPPDRHGLSETWRGQAIFACVFAPLGCLVRFYLSLKLNPINPSFPLGTFAVNVFGTAVLGMAYDLQRVNVGGSGVGGGRVGCQVLQGIMDGFDGCLTTVSTWILEIDGLKRSHAWKYGFATVVAGVSVLVVIMGSVTWTVGWTAIACVTSRT